MRKAVNKGKNVLLPHEKGKVGARSEQRLRKNPQQPKPPREWFQNHEKRTRYAQILLKKHHQTAENATCASPMPCEDPEELSGRFANRFSVASLRVTGTKETTPTSCVGAPNAATASRQELRTQICLPTTPKHNLHATQDRTAIN